MGEPYVRSEFKLKAKIGDYLFEDVVAINSTFGLNSIPTASLHVASGICVQDGSKIATIHKAIQGLNPRDPALVTLTVRTTDGETGKMMEDGEYIIFEGYYAGLGYQRSNMNSTYTLHLLHWLDDLNCSSMLNGNWFQGAPHDLAQNAVCYGLGQVGTNAGSGINFTPITEMEPQILTAGHMESDLWEECIKPLFLAISNMRHVSLQEDMAGATADASGFGGATNKAAQDALAKMAGIAPNKGKLPLNLKGLDEKVIQHSVQTGMSHLIKNGIAYSSFWSKLIGEIGAAFLFGVSPGVRYANVIPYFGGLSTEWLTIEADEYNYASFNCNVANLIESVNIFYSQQGNMGIESGGKTSEGYNSFYLPWGMYPPKEKRNLRGQIMLRDPPIWIANPVPQHQCTPGTTLGRGYDTFKPQAGPPTTTGGVPTAPRAERSVKSSRILDRFAEHWYKSSILSQRSGELSGKLRFDIAPGSTIKINAPDKSNDGENHMFATVMQVSYVINAEQHAAGTSFSLINVRTEKENGEENFTSPVPPLYKEGWPGGPLTEKS
jgi:hypothetical protein